MSKLLLFVLLIMPGGFVIVPAVLLLRRLIQRQRKHGQPRPSQPPSSVHAHA